MNFNMDHLKSCARFVVERFHDFLRKLVETFSRSPNEILPITLASTLKSGNYVDAHNS